MDGEKCGVQLDAGKMIFEWKAKVAGRFCVYSLQELVSTNLFLSGLEGVTTNQ